MRVDRALRMIPGIFNTFDSGSFNGLIGIRKFFHGFIVRLFQIRKPLGIAGLASAVHANLPGIGTEFVELSFQIALQLGGTFIEWFSFFRHCA